jgi:hypothetical protein
MRQACYLDGPNDVDWMFHNQLLSSREDGLHVDYVRYEYGAAWSMPAGNDVLGFRAATAVQRLVIALHRLGITSRRGLEVLADRWTGQVIEHATRWSLVAKLNARALTRLDDDGAALPGAMDAYGRRVISQWTFPLHNLDLIVSDVKLEDLQELRERRLAAQGW